LTRLLITNGFVQGLPLESRIWFLSLIEITKTMKSPKYLILILFFCSCSMFGAGTHGSIQRYRYTTSKDNLASAVATVIKENDQITLDLIKGHYNDEINYFTLFIKSGKDKYGYVLRYYGDQKSWNESSSAEIFLCYARINGVGGKEGLLTLRPLLLFFKSSL